MSSLVEHNETLVIKDESQIDDYGIMGAEYLPLAVNASLLIPDSIDCEEFVKIAEYEKSGTNIKFNIINHSENPTNISLPLVYYRGYRATDIDTKTELQIISGENGRVTCIIPSAYSGRISVGFKEPVYWRIAETISFIGFICILFCYFYKRSNVHSGGNKSEYI